MTGVQTGALVVALAVPVLGAVFANRRRWAQAAATVAAIAWLVLVAGAAAGRVGEFRVTPLIAAAGCGAALLTVAILEDLTVPGSAAATCVALSAMGIGLTVGTTGIRAVAVVAGLAVAAVLTLGAAPRTWRGIDGRAVSALLAVAGVVAGAAGFVVVHEEVGTWSLPTGGTQSLLVITVFLGAAALLSASGTLGRRRPTAILLAGGLAVGLLAAPLRAGADELGAVVVVLAAAAVVAAGARQGTLSLALLALAAAAGPAALAPSSRLLAAAAVISAAVGTPWAWLVAVPAGVSLGAGVIDDGSRLAVAVALAAGVVAGLLAQVASESTAARSRGAGDSGDTGLPPPLDVAWPVVSPGAWPALVVGAWLAVAPGTWTWAGAGLQGYDRGMARAVAAGLLAVVVWALAAARTLPPRRLRRPGRRAESLPPRRLRRPGRRAESLPPRRLRRPGRRARDPEPATPPVSPGEPSLEPAPPRQPPRQLVRSERSASTPRPRRATRSQRARPSRRASARARKQKDRRRGSRPHGGEGPPATR